MYTLVISSYWYIMHIMLLLLGVKPSIFIIVSEGVEACYILTCVLFVGEGSYLVLFRRTTVTVPTSTSHPAETFCPPEVHRATDG